MGINPYIVCLAFHQCDSETAHRNTRTQKTEAAKYSSLCQNVLISISLLADQIVEVFVAATRAQALCPLSYTEAFFNGSLH